MKATSSRLQFIDSAKVMSSSISNWDWKKWLGKKINKTLLPEKEDFYSPLNMEGTLLLADLFENFWNMCLEIYEIVFLLQQD